MVVCLSNEILQRPASMMMMQQSFHYFIKGNLKLRTIRRRGNRRRPLSKTILISIHLYILQWVYRIDYESWMRTVLFKMTFASTRFKAPSFPSWQSFVSTVLRAILSSELAGVCGFVFHIPSHSFSVLLLESLPRWLDDNNPKHIITSQPLPISFTRNSSLTFKRHCWNDFMSMRQLLRDWNWNLTSPFQAFPVPSCRSMPTIPPDNDNPSTSISVITFGNIESMRMEILWDTNKSWNWEAHC
jgi:hypothetical protein